MSPTYRNGRRTVVELPRYFVSLHAWTRMQQMGLTREQVLDIVENPEVDYSVPIEGRRIAAKGDLMVCYDPRKRRIITVLPWTLEEYTRPESETA